MSFHTRLAALALLLGTTAVAHADEGGDHDHVPDIGGLWWFHLETQFGPKPGTPIGISPDVQYWRGHMVYGLLHSSAAITGFTGIQSGSICVHDCDAWSSAYHGGAL